MTVEQDKETIDLQTSKNDKISWKRKRKKLNGLLEELDPVEEQILELVVVKNRIIDKVIEIKDQMVRECIHPAEDLVVGDDSDVLFCKFCERQIGVVKREG